MGNIFDGIRDLVIPLEGLKNLVWCDTRMGQKRCRWDTPPEELSETEVHQNQPQNPVEGMAPGKRGEQRRAAGSQLVEEHSNLGKLTGGNPAAQRGQGLGLSPRSDQYTGEVQVMYGIARIRRDRFATESAPAVDLPSLGGDADSKIRLCQGRRARLQRFLETGESRDELALIVQADSF